tara:strand:- start:378 stop:710 length:333 start_codon:yes stop_codon:yes gene_type:complete
LRLSNLLNLAPDGDRVRRHVEQKNRRPGGTGLSAAARQCGPLYFEALGYDGLTLRSSDTVNGGILNIYNEQSISHDHLKMRIFAGQAPNVVARLHLAQGKRASLLKAPRL